VRWSATGADADNGATQASGADGRAHSGTHGRVNG